jgi:YVTN family beta-propeller protein
VGGRSGYLHVAALGNNTVEVIDTKAGKVIHTVRDLREPQGITIVPAAKSFYVANAKDGSCHLYDLASYQLLGSIDLKADADNVRYDADARRVYVGYGDGALAVIDAETRAHFADVKLPAHPESFRFEKTGMALDEAGHRLYIGCRKPAKLLAIDTETGKTMDAVDCVGDTDDVWFDASWDAFTPRAARDS